MVNVQKHLREHVGEHLHRLLARDDHRLDEMDREETPGLAAPGPQAALAPLLWSKALGEATTKVASFPDTTKRAEPDKASPVMQAR